MSYKDQFIASVLVSYELCTFCDGSVPRALPYSLFLVVDCFICFIFEGGARLYNVSSYAPGCGKTRFAVVAV